MCFELAPKGMQAVGWKWSSWLAASYPRLRHDISAACACAGGRSTYWRSGLRDV